MNEKEENEQKDKRDKGIVFVSLIIYTLTIQFPYLANLKVYLSLITRFLLVQGIELKCVCGKCSLMVTIP